MTKNDDKLSDRAIRAKEATVSAASVSAAPEAVVGGFVDEFGHEVEVVATAVKNRGSGAAELIRSPEALKTIARMTEIGHGVRIIASCLGVSKDTLYRAIRDDAKLRELYYSAVTRATLSTREKMLAMLEEGVPANVKLNILQYLEAKHEATLDVLDNQELLAPSVSITVVNKAPEIQESI